MCCSFNFQGKNIRPSDKATVLSSGSSQLILQFGVRLANGKLVINARSETAAEKPMFMDALLHRRVAIPADCFHEWDSHKVKHTFSLPDRSVMYLAGLRDRNNFVILTTAANSSMLPVHDRMPLILEDSEIWLQDNDAYHSLLKRTPPELVRTTGSMQASLLQTWSGA